MAIEKPVREIEITKGFWMGESEVTVGAWKRYQLKERDLRLPKEDSFGRLLNAAAGNDSLPAVAITWSEARDFCVWAQAALPTEAQWEYAARAGHRSATYGDLDHTAWYGDNSGAAKIDTMQIFRDQNRAFGELLHKNGNHSHPVGMKQPNANGLFDMLGNVWEWTADWFSPAAYRDSAMTDPVGPLGGEQKIVRGGSWSTYASGVRFSARDRQSPDVRLSDVGFRCVADSLAERASVPDRKIVDAATIQGLRD